MASNRDQTTRLLQTCCWEMRRLIEAELRELTEVQERIDTFAGSPHSDGREVLAADLTARMTTLSRTNEQVLRLLYDLSDHAQKLARD